MVDWITPVTPLSYVSSHEITYDQFDNSFTVAQFTNTITAGTNTYTSAGMPDELVTKYDRSGNFIWATSIRGADNHWAGDIAYNGMGNVWVPKKCY